MNAPIKTPAQLKAEQLKANVNAPEIKEDDTREAAKTFTQEEVDAMIAKNTQDLNDEVEDLNNQVETEKEEKEKAITDLETSNSVNDELAKENEINVNKFNELEIASNKAKTIKPLDLKAKEEVRGNPLNTEYFTIIATNKSVSFSGFQFFKGEKYAVTGRNKKAIDTLISRKLWKKVKKD